jgi:hypothetical protein
MEIKAIETTYKGYKFRSRLEARWAVFFDALMWNWHYEHEGFELKSGRYLPDFYFPDFGYYAEVKPGILTDNDFIKCAELSKKYNPIEKVNQTGVILLEGMPELKSYRFLLGGGEVSEVIFIDLTSKYYPLYFGYDYDEDYFYGQNHAVKKSKSSRFEFGENINAI